jgi:hypothetical protein
MAAPPGVTGAHGSTAPMVNLLMGKIFLNLKEIFKFVIVNLEFLFRIFRISIILYNRRRFMGSLWARLI